MTTSFIERGTTPRRPTSLTESYNKMSIASVAEKNTSKVQKTKLHCSDDPKPDGQSPKSPRVIEVLRSSNSKSSTLSKSIRSFFTK